MPRMKPTAPLWGQSAADEAPKRPAARTTSTLSIGDQPGGVAESKRQKFRRMAEVRLRNTIKAMREFEKLGNRQYYEITSHDAEVILRQLKHELANLEESLKYGETGFHVAWDEEQTETAA